MTAALLVTATVAAAVSVTAPASPDGEPVIRTAAPIEAPQVARTPDPRTGGVMITVTY